MGQVLQFRAPAGAAHESRPPTLDLLSAVDFALRDLMDIAGRASDDDVREQALACLAMLSEAYGMELERA